MRAFDGIVLVGGRSTRMGADKAALSYRGTSFLERAVAALDGARSVIAVGPERDVPRVRWTREHPPGSGPAAALAAGVELVEAEVVVVLPVDVPVLDQSSVESLIDAVAYDGAVAIDDAGRRQLPTGAFRTDALSRRLADFESHDGISLQSIFDRLHLGEVWIPGAVDCDTPEQLRRLLAANEKERSRHDV